MGALQNGIDDRLPLVDEDWREFLFAIVGELLANLRANRLPVSKSTARGIVGNHLSDSLVFTIVISLYNSASIS